MSTGTARAQNRGSDIWPRRSAKRVYAAHARGGDWFLAHFASHCSRDASEGSFRACRRRHRGSVVDADAPEARELHGGMAEIKTSDQAEDVNLDAFDPTELDAEEAPQRGFDAGAAVGQPDIGVGAEVLAHRV